LMSELRLRPLRRKAWRRMAVPVSFFFFARNSPSATRHFADYAAVRRAGLVFIAGKFNGIATYLRKCVEKQKMFVKGC